MALTLPYTISPLANINAEPLQGNFQAIADKFSGGIGDADISSLANITGSKLAPNSVPGDRIATGTITQTQMAAGSVGTTQLIANAVTKDKLSVTAGQRVTKTQMELAVFTGTAGFTIGGGNAGFGFQAHVKQATVGGVNSWIVEVWQFVSTVAGGTPIVRATATLTPVSAIPVATTTPIGVVLKNPTLAAGGGQVDVEMWYITNS